MHKIQELQQKIKEKESQKIVDKIDELLIRNWKRSILILNK